MEKNKKGFTLTEIIIVIVILAILALIAIPGIGKLIENGKINYNKNLEKELILMAKNYYADNKAKLPRGQLNDDGDPMYTTSVSLEELENGNYVTNKVVDADKGSCEESYVYVENESGGYEYYPCLACDNYTSDNAYCSIDSEGAGTGKNPVCEITYQDYVPGTWTNKDVTANITGYHESGIPFYMVNSTIKLNATNNNATYKITDGGSFIVEAYSRTGNKGVCSGGTTKGDNGEDDDTTKIKIDKTAPVCERIIIENTTSIISKNVTITAKDEASGIKSISVSGNQLTVTKNELEGTGIYNAKTNGTYTAKVTDEAGNSTNCNFTVTGLCEFGSWTTTACNTSDPDMCQSKQQYRTRSQPGTTHWTCPSGMSLGNANYSTCGGGCKTSHEQCSCSCPSGYGLVGCSRLGADCVRYKCSNPTSLGYPANASKPSGCKGTWYVANANGTRSCTTVCDSYNPTYKCNLNCSGIGGCGSASLEGEKCYYRGSSWGAYCDSGYTLVGSTCYTYGSWIDGTCPSGQTCETRTVYRTRTC